MDVAARESLERLEIHRVMSGQDGLHRLCVRDADHDLN